MKSISYSLIAAAAAVGMAFGAETATTAPVGYTTHTLAANTFNLVGLTLQSPSVASGSITTINATTLNSSGSNFSTALTAGSTYILEITNGTGKGVIQEVTAWSGENLTLPENITTSGVAAGNTFRLRKAPTLEEVFGTTTTVLTKGFNSGNADVVWVPQGNGNYTRYYLHNTSVWRNAETNTNTPNIPLIYADGMLIEKKNASASLVVSGEVKKEGTNSVMITGFNVVSIVAPAGSTLQNSGLETSITPGFNSGNADVVWVPVGGAYKRYFRHSSNVWRDVDTGTNVVSDVTLPSAVWIERKGGTAKLSLAVPAAYDNF